MAPNRLTASTLRRLESRASAGDADALDELAMHHRDGARDGRGRVIVRENKQRAIRLFLRAAEAGRAESMTSLATMLDDAGRTKEALRWYRRAVRRGDPLAAFNLGVLHKREGRFRLAVRWLQRAARQSDASATLELALAELYGTGRARNAPRALKTLARLYRNTGDQLTPFEREQICIVIARAHLEGWLAPRNVKTAKLWLERGRALGSEEADGLLRDLSD